MIDFLPKVIFDVLPQVREAASLIDHIYAQHGYDLLITSARDSEHTPGSLHYLGGAIDFKSKGLPSSIKQSIYARLKQTFPMPTWWTDLEFLGGALEHFHVGYNPARQRADIESNIFSTFLPVASPSHLPETGYVPDNENYPSRGGIIGPEYFSPVEIQPDWTVYLLIGAGIFILLTVLDK